MDFVKALTFIPEDPRWKEKILLGTVVMLVSGALMPILIGVVGILIVMGYCVRMLRNIGNGDRLPLPEWDDWGGDLTRGFKLFVVSFVWALPIILLTIPVGVSGIFMGIGSENESGFFTAIGGIGMSFGYCLLLLYGIFYALVTPGFTLWYARTDEISGGLRFTDIWHWTRDHLSAVILYVVAVVIASFLITTVASLAGIVLCVIGLIVTVPLGSLLVYLYQYHLLGQIEYKDRTGQPYVPPVAPVAAPVASAPVPPAAPGSDQSGQ